MKKLRLLMTDKCNRRCRGCCNKQWDLSKLPNVRNFFNWECVMITGGEPMLDPDKVLQLARYIKKYNPRTPVYLYTAKIDDWDAVRQVLEVVDGMTVTLHVKRDLEAFRHMNAMINFAPSFVKDKTMRLNVFKGVTVKDEKLEHWSEVKKNMRWIKDCPLPNDEVFMKLHDACK